MASVVLPSLFPPKRAGSALLGGVAAFCMVASTLGEEPARRDPLGTPIDRTVIKLARSSDGKSFSESDGILLRGAASPTIARMRGGDLLLVVDYAPADDESPTLSVTRSTDNGQHWSALRPLRIDAPVPVLETASNPALVRTADGRLLLYFTSRPVQTRRSSPVMIFAAETRDGLNYRIDRSMRLGLPNSSDAHPIAIVADDHVHLLVDRIALGRGGRVDAAVLEHFVSPDGSDFARVAPVRFENLRFAGDVVAQGDGYRAFATAPGGIRSLRSRDLREWKEDDGIRIAKAWDPAVLAAKDGSMLMAYCSDLEGDAKGGLVETGQYFEDFDASEWADEAGDDGAEGNGDEAAVFAEGVGDLKTKDWKIEPGTEDDWWNFWDPEETDGFAPVPDFQTKVDYFSWYSDYLMPDPQDNAYDAYAQFMPEMYPDDPENPIWWPDEIKDMYGDESFEGSPGPWRGEDHPEWASSNEEIQGLLDQFSKTAQMSDYATPPHTDKEFKPEESDDERLLMGILLPNLGKHRRLSRAMLADAWRVGEDGKVSSEKMQRAIKTTLRGADHLDQGQTLIEELVAKAERDLTRDTALRALDQDVFSADELESVLDTMQRWDIPPADPAKGARGEHGFAMDIMQYMFSPPTEDGEPQFNRARVAKVQEMMGGDAAWVDNTAKMTPEDVRASIDAFDRHYHNLVDQMRIGYPSVRASDIKALEEETVHTSPVTEALLPALGHVYKMKTRAEATRRATQLTYAVHLYHKQNGRWPATLDELPARYSEGVRTDPYTGWDFKYEVTDKGPRIYSLSENERDDGGRHSPRWGDDAGEGSDESDDYVFYPPQPRK